MTAASSARDVMPSLGKIRYRWLLTVRCERYSCWPDLSVAQPFSGQPRDLQLLRGQQVQRPRGWLAAALAGCAQRRARLGGLLATAQPHAMSELQPRAVQRPAGQAGAEGSRTVTSATTARPARQPNGRWPWPSLTG